MTDLFEAEATTTTSLDLRRLQRQKRRVRRRSWALVLIAVGLVLTAVAGSVAWNFVQTTFERDETVVADYDGLGQGRVQVIIEPGQNGTQIAATLFEQGVVASEQAFVTAWANSPDAQSIQPGFYFMQREMKAEYALLALLDPNNRDLRKITVIEGKTLETYFEGINDLLADEYTIEDVRAAAEDHAAIGLPAEANGSLEGWLFPSTYQFNPGVTPTDVLSAMVAQTVKVLEGLEVPRDQWLRTLTIASLIEREAKLDVDRPLISGVIANRLENGMKLELDATVKYFKPSEGAFITNEDKAIDDPYNTYFYTGLPPGPISGAGAASIEAATAPADHNYIFYVTVDLATGETRYAETYNGHLDNVALLRKWMEENA